MRMQKLEQGALMRRSDRSRSRLGEEDVRNVVCLQKTHIFYLQKSPSAARRGNNPAQKKPKVKEAVDILTMNLERDPSDTESCLEMLLNTLCRNFKMKPKQAAALLTNNNQYLVHSVVKGVKGRFEPVVSWY